MAEHKDFPPTVPKVRQTVRITFKCGNIIEATVSMRKLRYDPASNWLCVLVFFGVQSLNEYLVGDFGDEARNPHWVFHSPEAVEQSEVTISVID